MSRFITDDVTKISLSESEYVEVRQQISFAKMSTLLENLTISDTSANLKIAMPLLKEAIVNWNLEEKGKQIPCTPEMIEKLDLNTIMELLPKVMELYFPDAKKEQASVA